MNIIIVSIVTLAHQDGGTRLVMNVDQDGQDGSMVSATDT